MNHIEFPEANHNLGAGKENENTQPMRVMLCEHPQYQPGTKFYAAKFDLEPEEKAFIREQIKYKLSEKGLAGVTTQQLDAIIEALPNLWITSMHGWCPLILSVAAPQQMGYERVVKPAKPSDN